MAAAAARGRRRHFDAWPGYVDVLSTLLMVVIFVLMVFVIAQVFLSRALSGRDEELAAKAREMFELNQQIGLKDTTIEQLQRDLSDLANQLGSSTKARDELQQRLTVVIGERDSLAASLADVNSQLAQSDEQKEKLDQQITVLLQTGKSDKEAIASLRAALDNANKVADENKAALVAALAEIEAGKKSAAETRAALEAALAAARSETEQATRETAEQKEFLAQKLAELESAYKSIDADKEKIETMLAEIAALQKARDDLAKETAANQAALAQKSTELENAYKSIDADKEKMQTLLAEIAALEKLRDDLARQVADSQAALAAAKEESDKAFKTAAEQKAALDARLVELENAYKAIEADKAKVTALLGDIAALESLRDDLADRLFASEEQVKANAAAADQANTDLAAEKKLSENARLQVELLNRQVLALREQLAELGSLLDASEAKAEEQGVQIADLGKRLNEALANKVAELAGYRSEFFGRLKQVLGERPDIQIVGDRFVFQSEVLFDVASAQIGEAGKQQLAQFAQTLLEIAAKIPSEIDWILRVDGHTDRRPIYTAQFQSNWELSAARAIAVVNFLQSQGVPPERLVAAGFAENRPLDPGDDEIAYRRNRRIELKLDQR
jgi:chemotaxis protein MotB